MEAENNVAIIGSIIPTARKHGRNIWESLKYILKEGVILFAKI